MAEDNLDAEAIQKELDLLKKEYKLDVNNDAISKAKEEAKAEIMKELEAKKIEDERVAENVALKAEIEKHKSESAAKVEELQKRVDEMKASKQTINADDPFQGRHTNQEDVINRMTDEDIRKIEEEQGLELFGPEYAKRHKEY